MHVRVQHLRDLALERLSARRARSLARVGIEPPRSRLVTELVCDTCRYVFGLSVRARACATICVRVTSLWRMCVCMGAFMCSCVCDICFVPPFQLYCDSIGVNVHIT